MGCSVSAKPNLMFLTEMGDNIKIARRTYTRAHTQKLHRLLAIPLLQCTLQSPTVVYHNHVLGYLHQGTNLEELPTYKKQI